MANNWRVLSEETLLDHVRVLVTKQRVVLPSGIEVEEYVRIRTQPFVSILAVTADGKLICERQYKHGPGFTVITLVSGGIEPGETPAIAAKRELLEETGYSAKAWVHLATGVTYANAAGSCFYSFLALDCRKSAEPVPIDLEDIVIELLSPAELLDNVMSGKSPIASDATTILHGFARLGLMAGIASLPKVNA